MTTRPIDTYLAQLDTVARAASGAEDAYRRDAVERIKGLERARAFAFRRLNLVRTVASSMSGAKDEEEAKARGSAAFLKELNWNGASEAQREVVARFMPIVAALWQMDQEGAGSSDVAGLDKELTAFENWFAENRNGSFLSLMDGEVLELPLVEV